MANKKNEKTEVIEVSKGEKFVQDYGKVIAGVAIAVIVVVGGIIGWNALQASKNAEALNNNDEYWEAQMNFDAQQYEAAFDGFTAVLAEYGSTTVGNTCNAYAGLCKKELGQYEEAISYLKEFSGDDQVLAPAVLSALGDCQVETGDLAGAASNFEKAAKLAASPELSPLFLKKAGLCYEKLNDNASALKVYQSAVDNYATSDLVSTIEKYIVRVK